MTDIGQYAHEYDKKEGANKVAEPYFDGFLVGIASLSDNVFDETFMYLETTKKDEQLVYKTADTVEWKDSMLKTDVVPNSEKTRKDLNYSEALHIYVMGPATESCVNHITTLFGKSENTGKTFIIHIQGEANSIDAKLKTTEFSAPCMTPKVGMFSVAFNLWTGEQEMYELRKLCTESYTVCIKPTEIKTKYIPYIYYNILDDILYNILFATKPVDIKVNIDALCTKLNNVLVCQDTYDKDNLVAMAMAIKNSRVPVTINIIARRLYIPAENQNKIFGFNDANRKIQKDIQTIMTIDGQSPPIGYMRCCDNKEWQSPITINVSAPEEIEQTNLAGNVSYDRTGTRDLLKLLYTKIPEKVKNWCTDKDIQFDQKVLFTLPNALDIADSIDDISRSRRCPFPETMFVYIDYLIPFMETRKPKPKPPTETPPMPGGGKRTKNKRKKHVGNSKRKLKHKN